jgi:hypothetical protein
MITKTVTYSDPHDIPDGCSFIVGRTLFSCGFTRGGVPYGRPNEKGQYPFFLEITTLAWKPLCIEHTEFSMDITLIYDNKL